MPSTLFARTKAKILLFLLLIAAMTTPVFAQDGEMTLQILHASDLEGGVSAIGDAPNFAAIVEALEAEADAEGMPSILLSAGDNYIPGPFFNASGDRSMRDVFRAAIVAQLGLPADTETNLREGVGRADISIMNMMALMHLPSATMSLTLARASLKTSLEPTFAAKRLRTLAGSAHSSPT